MTYDLVISNGTIINGSGEQGYRADLGIKDSKIVAIERNGIPTELARKTVDAMGRTITPGFIDTHGHSDVNVLCNPNAESKIRQGITTEIISNCGDGVFPLRGASLEDAVIGNSTMGVDINWQTAEEYFDLVDKTQPAINIAAYVGHGMVRLAVVGDDDRRPTPEELKLMEHEVELAMQAGAIGLSTGLIYPPGLFADETELLALQGAAAKYGGIYSSHVRGEGDTLLEAADEFENIVRKTKSRGQFSHLKASGPRNWGKVQQVIDKIEAMNADGLAVYFDRYPYNASSTSLQSMLPRWVLDGGRPKAMERLRDPALVGGIVEEVKRTNEGKDGWNSVLICQAHCAEYEQYQGKSIGDIARALNKNPDDVFVELLLLSGIRTSINNFTMCQEETDLALTHPLGMPGTDAGCRAPYGPLSLDTPHPRAYGTYGKFFRDYVKERKLLTLEEAVRRCTSMPADVFGIKMRGRIEIGYYADILVIDFDNFEDKAVFGNPHQYCTGIDAVIVNGILTLENGEQTGQRGGVAIRRRE